MVVSIGLAQGCYSETHGCHKVVTSKLDLVSSLWWWKVVYNLGTITHRHAPNAQGVTITSTSYILHY